MLVYQLDELGIFFVAVFTLRSSKMEEKHGRILKLIGGMLMLTLAVVMLVDPSIMNSLSSSLIVFAIAFAAIIAVLLLHRLVLPAAGIRLGSEFNPAKRKRRTGGKAKMPANKKKKTAAKAKAALPLDQTAGAPGRRADCGDHPGHQKSARKSPPNEQ
jgi:choline-glycine betaine transporter